MPCFVFDIVSGEPRQARVVTDAQKSGKSLADLPPPKPSAPDPSLIPCPHCGRRFSELAGERHMQHCKNIKAKVRSLFFRRERQISVAVV